MRRLDSLSLRKEGEGKYLEKNNIFLRRIRKSERKRRTIFEEGKYSFAEEKENEENILIRKLLL